MRAAVRPSIRLRIVIYAIWVLFATHSNGMAQPADVAPKGVPYRRVFVPSRDLEALGLESFNAIDIRVLEKLLQKDSEVKGQLDPVDPPIDSSTSSRFKSTYYVAKLVGADLLSECSQLTLAGSPYVGDRVTLSPWSLAVQSPTVRGVKPESRGPANWLFDERGFPSVPTYPIGTADVADAKRRDVSCKFGWSTRADATSTPNKLRFSFELPKCANSCLMLVLPPYAQVQECTTVSRRLSDWSEVEERLSGWTDFSQDFAREPATPNSPDALWLIELGGSQAVSFSIAMSVGTRPQDMQNAVNGLRYMQLIRTQNLVHSVEGQEIRTICDAEVFVSAEQPRLRMSLASGSRLRSFTVNQQNVDWQVNDGWIDCDIRSVIQGMSEPNPVRVAAEFFTPLVRDNLDRVDTLRVMFDRGYVMAGTTVLNSVSPWRLTNVACDSNRIAEPQGDAKSMGLNRLEYSWYAIPPSLSIGLEQSNPTRRCEVLTHFSNDSAGLTANFRAKLFFSEQDSSQVKVEIALGWSIVSAISVDPSVPVTVESEAPSNTAYQTLRLSWDRVEKNRIGEFELRLYRPADPSDKQSRHVYSSSLVRLPGWRRSNTLVAEDNGLFELKLTDSLLDVMTTEESIPEWQRPLLSKISKHKIFTTDSQSLEHSVELPLDWSVKPSRPQASTMTEIDRASNSLLRARHEIMLSPSRDYNEPISIFLPSDNVIWRLKSGDDWVPLSPLDRSSDSNSSDTGLWRFDLRQVVSACSLLAVVHADSKGHGEVMFPLPSVLNCNMLAQDARCKLGDFKIRTVGTPSTWSVDDGGTSFLRCSVGELEAKNVLAASAVPGLPTIQTLILKNECHLSIDSFGSQLATIVYLSNNPFRKTIAIELEEQWEPLAVRARSVDSTDDVPFRIEGRKLIVNSENRWKDGVTEMQIELIGPRLSKESRIRSLGEMFSFRWPVFVCDTNRVSQRRVLWLPRELKLADSEDLRWYQDDHRWPLWRWSRQALAALFGVSISSNSSVAYARESVMDVSSEWLPKWAAAGWHAVLVDSQPFDSYPSNYSSQDQPIMAVQQVDGDRTYLALVFAVLTLLTPRIILLRYHVSALLAALLIACAHFAPVGLARFATSGLTGMSLGFMAFVIYRVLSKPLSIDKSLSQRHTAKWSANLSSPAFILVVGWGLVLPNSWNSVAIGDDRLRDESAIVYQIVIPIDESGSMEGTTAYVPSEMLNILNGTPDRVKRIAKGTHPISARHILRMGSRNRFTSGDQITMVYEFMVGDDLAPVRFPMNTSQLLLPRFTVDGTEVNLSSRLKSTGSEWIWTPEKPGKHLVQITSQPVLKSNATDRNRESLARFLDIAILPVANATLEIETDPKNSLEITSRGRVTDPTEGRFVAMLGALDRLKFTVTTPITRMGNGLTFPSAPVVDGAETPVMHTELFLQNEILQAKTIIDFPKGALTGREIEVEADLQWLPIGTLWGDAEWVETRSGSTLSKRKYILEWRNESTSASVGQPSTRDRQISVVWVPESASQSLNVLFAECRERGTRRGSLRYSRAAGANWSIEGVGAWIPAIGSKDRLDWPELKTNLLATSLRIPPNGGFGILKPKSLLDRPQQARVSTKWSIDSNREALVSRIELLPGSSVSEPLVIELQDDFVVTELSNRSGPIRYLLNRSNGKIQIQVLAERKSLEVSDLLLQAKRADSAHWQSDAAGKWFELPWLNLPSTVNSDQTLEIVANEITAFRLESEPGWIFGKGQNTSALNLAKSYADIHASALASSRYQVIHRDNPLVGKLSLKQVMGFNSREIELSAHFIRSVASRPSFAIEIPGSLKDRWQSESRITTIPCPDPNKAWLQVHLPEPSTNETETPVESLIRFSPRPEDWTVDSDWANRIHAVDERIPTLRSEAADDVPSAQGEKNLSTSSGLGNERSSSRRSATRIVLSVLDDHFMPNRSNRNILLRSQYWISEDWIEDSKGTLNEARELEWTLGPGVEVLAIEVNGRLTEFQQDDRSLQFATIPLGVCDDIRVYSKHPVDGAADRTSIINAPELFGVEQGDEIQWLGNSNSSKIEIQVGSKRIVETKNDSDFEKIAVTCLRFLELSQQRWPNAVQLEPSSVLANWRKHWGAQASTYLREWSDKVQPEQQLAFAQAIEQWHSLVPLAERRMRSKSDVGLFFSVPKTDIQRADKDDRTVSHGSKTSSEGTNGVGKWISMLGCLIILASVVFAVPSYSGRLADRPWWSLLFLGLFAWIVFGSVLPALVLGSLGLIVAIDSYGMVTARLRRNGIRGLRSP